LSSFTRSFGRDRTAPIYAVDPLKNFTSELLLLKFLLLLDCSF